MDDNFNNEKLENKNVSETDVDVNADDSSVFDGETGFHPGYEPPVQNSHDDNDKNVERPYGYEYPSGQPSNGGKRGSSAFIFVFIGVFLLLIALAVIGILGLGDGGLPSLFDTSSAHSEVSDTPSVPVSSVPDESEVSSNNMYSSGDLSVSMHDVPDETAQQTGVTVAEKVCPSIVGVLTYERTGSRLTFDGMASGIILSEDGFIITNAHVVKDADKVSVALYSPDGMSESDAYDAEVVGIDSRTDIALIKIEASGLVPAEFADSNQVRVGETVYAIGNPGSLELSSSISQGLVSGLNRTISNIGLIQTDVAINPGNSGGALVNVYGQVIGITSEKLVTVSSISAEGLSFAIPSNTALQVLDDLLVNGSVTGRVVLKITVVTYSSVYAQSVGLPAGCLLCIDTVEQGSNAYKAGLRSGMMIYAFNGVRVSDVEGLRAERDKCKAGDSVTITVYDEETGENNDYSFILEEDLEQ